jgi:UDP-galactopyranose mutase
MHDFIIVGSGFFGSICARELSDSGYKCLVLESRDHIGGNCYTEERDGINIHKYGPHIFHTSNEEVWSWINNYTSFNDYTFSPVANYRGEIYSLPFNMWTFSKLFNIVSPEQAKKIIEEQSRSIVDPKNLEEQAIKLVGYSVYEKLIKGYTAKQWKKDPSLLPKEIIKRLPVRFTYDNNYFNDKYQGIPIGGYTGIFNKLLDGIEIKFGIDYLKDKDHWNSRAKKIIYTGPIDRFYGYKFGQLEYKTTRFEHKLLDIPNYQGTSVMNYTDIDTDFTRTIEHKHFEKIDSKNTWVTWEYPADYNPEKTEAMYPVNDPENNLKYSRYKEISENETNILFGGRLAEYKYYDMHQVIYSALSKVKEIKKNSNDFHNINF